MQSFSNQGQQQTPEGDLRRANVVALTAMVEEYEELLPFLTWQERLDLDYLLKNIDTPLWVPFPGPQTVAIESEADELFYGGAAGGGKTDLLLGLALNHHWRSIIFRREYAELKGIRDRAEELFENIGKFNGMLELWRFKDAPYTGKRVEFGACQYEGDERKFQGRPHDLKGFDEITQFTEAQYRFLSTWNRSTIPGQRVRIVATGNPPVSAEGRWVIDYWGPWLNPSHVNPAEQGELRWFVTGTDGKDFECPDQNPVLVRYEDGTEDWTWPKSRTFIRARVEDNPRLMETGYRRTLQNLPEPLRSRMLRGDFGVGHEDHEWQVIPTDWILAAQARWAPTFEDFLVKREKAQLEAAGVSSGDTPRPPDPTQGTPLTAEKPPAGIPESLKGGSGAIGIDAFIGKQTKGEESKVEFMYLTKEELLKRKGVAQETGCIGVDVSRGGRHSTIIAERLDQWFAPLIEIPGKQTQDGQAVVQTLINLGFQKRRIHIDVTGVGTSPVDIGRMYDMNIVPMVGSETKNIGHVKDVSGKLGFLNARAMWWWKFREALDPTLGEGIALPPDSGLLADLTAPRWMLSARGIQVEQKEHIKDRLGRSPDKGDAVVMAHATPYIVAAAYLIYLKEQVDEARALTLELQQKNGRT